MTADRPSDPIRLLFAEDDAPLRSVIARELARRGYAVTVAEDGTQAVACLEKQVFDAALLDVRMPGLDGLEVLSAAREADPAPEVVMLTGNATIDVAVEAMKRGACDFVTKPCRLDALDRVLRGAVERGSLRRENAALKRRLARADAGLISVSAAMREVRETIERIATSDGTVLLVGESGTGKDVAVRVLHASSPRAQAPLVDVNCGAIPENLLESELFGHEKGSFTGADAARPGLFEMAHRGTLFLDEIGDLPLGLQVKLLRAIEAKSFYRVGGRRRIDVDVRVAAATNRDLAADIEQGRFRKDLYYRLNALQIALPPLRERPEDIPVLARHFAAPRSISPDAMEALRRYPWPGNVRELKNVIERALLLGKAGTIEPEALPSEMLRRGAPPGVTVSGGSASPRVDAAVLVSPAGKRLAEIEREKILEVMDQVRWHRGRAAEILGISPKTLYRKLRSYGIDG